VTLSRRYVSQKGKKDEYSNIIEEYNLLEKVEDENIRGTKLESFIISLLKRSGINSLDSYRTAIGDKTFTQIDGGCRFDSRYYIIEAKWQSKKCGVGGIRQLLDKMMNGLDDNYGLLVSISGFTRDAIATAQRNILKNVRMILMDGEELKLIVNNNCIADALLAKQLELHLKKNAYYKYELTNKNIAAG
jgi:hypothetical protein